jgi:hypothetical protein
MSSFMMPAREPLLRASSPLSMFALRRNEPTLSPPPPINRRLEISHDPTEPTEVTFAPGGSWWFDPSSVTLTPIQRSSSPPSNSRRSHSNDASATAHSFVGLVDNSAIREQLSPSGLAVRLPITSTTPVTRDSGIASLLAARSPYRPHAATSTPSGASSTMQLRMPHAPPAVSSQSSSNLAALDEGQDLESGDVLLRWACASCPLNDVLRLPRAYQEIRFCPQCGTKQPPGVPRVS